MTAAILLAAVVALAAMLSTSIDRERRSTRQLVDALRARRTR